MNYEPDDLEEDNEDSYLVENDIPPAEDLLSDIRPQEGADLVQVNPLENLVDTVTAVTEEGDK